MMQEFRDLMNRLRLNIASLTLFVFLFVGAGSLCYLHDLRRPLYAGTTSGKTVNDLIEISRDLLAAPTGESGSSAFWKDATLQRYLYQGIRDTIAKTHCLQKSETIVLTTGTSEYPITDNFVTITNAIWTSSVTEYKTLLRSDPVSLGRIDEDTEDPEYYLEYDDHIELFPFNTGLSGTSLIAYYVPRQSDLTNGVSSIPTPASLDPALVYYVVEHAWLQDRRFGEAQMYRKLYETEIAHYRQDFVYQKEELKESAVIE